MSSVLSSDVFEHRGFPPERTPRKPIDDISEGDTTSILITREDSCVDQSLDTVAEMKMLEEDRLNADLQRKRERDIRELQVWCLMEREGERTVGLVFDGERGRERERTAGLVFDGERGRERENSRCGV